MTTGNADYLIYTQEVFIDLFESYMTHMYLSSAFTQHLHQFRLKQLTSDLNVREKA